MGLISRVSSRTYRNQKSQTKKKPKMGRRGPKKHLKTLAAPHHWMLPKTGGVFAHRPNADSSSTESPPKKLLTTSAESRKSSSKRTTFHSWSHTTADPSDTQTQTAKSATPSNSTLPPTRFPTGSNSTPVTCAKSSAVRTLVEWEPSNPENDTQDLSILSTSKMLPDTFSLPEPATSSSWEKVIRLWFLSHETRVSEKLSPKNEMQESNND